MGRTIFFLLLGLLGTVIFGGSLITMYKAKTSGQPLSSQEKRRTWAWLVLSLLILAESTFNLVYPAE